MLVFLCLELLFLNIKVLVLKLSLILLVCIKLKLSINEWCKFLIICIVKLYIWFLNEIGSIILFNILSFWLEIFLIKRKFEFCKVVFENEVFVKNGWLIYEILVFVLIKVNVLIFEIEILIVFFLIVWVKLILV